MIRGWFLQKNIPKQKSPLILRQNDSGPGCKERPLWSSGQKCIIWEHSWPIWPCNLIHVPVCQLAEHRAQNRSFSCSFTALFSLCDTLSSLFFFFFLSSNFFLFCLINAGFFGRERAVKNLTAWLGVTHGFRGVLGSFSTFNGSLKLAFSENKSKQVSFVLRLIHRGTIGRGG